MKRVHIVGGKNHGKTTLVAELVVELRGRGLQVGTIKHTHHQHELDTPGKDSHTHREAGAAVVGILTRSMNAVFWPRESGASDSAEPDNSDQRYAQFAPSFAECDVVIVEGDTRTAAPKLEVWRAVNETPSIADRLAAVRAVVTDDPIETSLPVLPRTDIAGIADFVLRQV